jgi:hypothetical protein
MLTFTQTFIALVNEAEFTKEMLGAGATQIRQANYATRGIYFQAFTSLATGLERIGKLCLMELVGSQAMKSGEENVPFFSEIFRTFYNDGATFKK